MVSRWTGNLLLYTQAISEFMSFWCRLGASAEPELDGWCNYPTGRGLRLPLRRQGARAELELDGWCNYPTGQGLRLPSRRHMACAARELELDGWCY